MSFCEHCIDQGGMIFCEALNRGVPTAGTGEPVRPEDCPYPDYTSVACEAEEKPDFLAPNLPFE